MQVNSPVQKQPPAASQDTPASTFPYGLGYNINLQNDHQNLNHTNAPSDSAAHVTNFEPEFEAVGTYLRFPLTKCHHLVPFKMPETFLDGSSDSVLPCGCWTGRAPDAQMQEATLFVDYVGAETSFKSVWDVTGLEAGGCWECGALEFEVADGNEAGGPAIENGNSHDHAGWGHIPDGGMQRVYKKTGEIMSIKQAFLKDCQQWQKMEEWKDEWWDGDMTERGAKLMAESRWARSED
jgi:hypothetical protein